MDLLGQFLTGQMYAGTPGPTEDFWYQPAGYGAMTSSGVRIDADGAKKISAWFRGRDILATALAMLPLHMMQRLPDDGGAEPARNHQLYDVLHRKPNASDDSFTWRRQKVYDLIDHGWAYDWITIGQTWSLDRVDPSFVTPERIKSGPNKGRFLFHVRDEITHQTTTHTQDEIFFLRLDSGKGILEHARDSLGLARTTETYAGKIYGAGTLNGGTITVPGAMDPDSARAMAQSFVTAAGNWHMPRVLPNGATIVESTLTPEKAQMLLSRKFSINDIARWLGLPPHMLGDLDRATFSNIEHQGQEFVTYSLGPWLSLFEFGINDQLILQPNRFYAEFVRDALVRGDIAARWAAYQIAVTTGTYTRNEVRRLENKKMLDGLDEPLDPAHLTGKGGSDNAPKEPAKAPPKAEMIATASAARLLRKEITAVQKFAVRCAMDQDAFAQAVTDFYDRHAELVATTLMMGMDDAREYCAGQAAQVVAGEWTAALTLWGNDHYAAGLAALALQEAA
jgi:HK97 family phage portal protein